MVPTHRAIQENEAPDHRFSIVVMIYCIAGNAGNTFELYQILLLFATDTIVRGGVVKLFF